MRGFLQTEIKTRMMFISFQYIWVNHLQNHFSLWGVSIRLTHPAYFHNMQYYTVETQQKLTPTVIWLLRVQPISAQEHKCSSWIGCFTNSNDFASICKIAARWPSSQAHRASIPECNVQQHCTQVSQLSKLHFLFNISDMHYENFCKQSKQTIGTRGFKLLAQFS